MPEPAREVRPPTLALTILLLAYVAVVHIADTLAAQGSTAIIDWRLFRWRLPSGFDLFKFTVWFVVPFAFTLQRIDLGWFGTRRWRRVDWIILAALMGAGALAVSLVAVVPSLGGIYPPFTSSRQAWHAVVWTLSWLTGWEYLHRYALLRRCQTQWPRYGWLAVPLAETLYHLQKPPLEMAGMLVFSLAVTYWAAKRRNALMPALAHLIIELELIAFRLAA